VQRHVDMSIVTLVSVSHIFILAAITDG